MRLNWRPFLLVAVPAIIGWALMLFVMGCHPRPRFSNGDRTANVTYQEVVESDMPQFGQKPEAVSR